KITPPPNSTAANTAKPSSAAAPTQDSSAPASSASSNQSAGASGLLVELRATDDVWVSAASDGPQAVGLMIKAGDTRQIKAERQLVLKTGNAGALQVTFNGKQLPTLGKDKQVKTLTFTPEGLQ